MQQGSNNNDIEDIIEYCIRVLTAKQQALHHKKSKFPVF